VMVSWGQREHLTGPYTALAGASFSVASGSNDAQACVLGSFVRQPLRRHGLVMRLPTTPLSASAVTLACSGATRLRMLATSLLCVQSCEKHQRRVRSSHALCWFVLTVMVSFTISGETGSQVPCAVHVNAT
jgi:hypothetical protein